MIIEPSNVSEIQERYFSFFDAVVDHVTLRTGSALKVCSVAINCQDKNSETGWAAVEFELIEVQEFSFKYGKTTYEVLSSGVQFFWENDFVYVFFDAYPDDDGMPNLETNTAFVSAKKCLFRNLSQVRPRPF